MLTPRVLGGVLLAAAAIAGCGGGGGGERALGPLLTVSPSTGGKHDRVSVAITNRRATGLFGKTRRSYTVEAHAVRPAIGCVNNRDRGFPEGPAGKRVRAELDPARGEGGHLGWCPGLFRGTVTYFEGFACPPAGTCREPDGFPTRKRVVARFSFHVR